MTPKELRQFKELGVNIAQQADYLNNNIHGGRVTHTESTLQKLINHICQINKHIRAKRGYANLFERMLFQCRAGPLEVTIQKDVIYIQGVVSIDALKEFFIVNEPPGFKALEIAEAGE